MTYVFCLDRYHLGDPLFLNRLGRDLARLAAPRAVVHGPGDEAERALEADGSLVSWEGGVPVSAAAGATDTIARTTRELNRRVVHALNDGGVAAVRLEASSRGLFRMEGDELRPGAGDWLSGLMGQGAVPVVASLFEAAGADRVLEPGDVAARLAVLAGEATVVFFGRGLRLGVPGTDGPVALDALAPSVLEAPGSVAAVLALGARVVVTGAAGIGEGAVLGTVLTPA